MNFLTHIFQGFWLEFKLLFTVFWNSTSNHFSKDLLIAASLSTCNNSHTCIFNFWEKCFPFLLFILTHSYLSYIIYIYIIYIIYILYILHIYLSIIYILYIINMYIYIYIYYAYLNSVGYEHCVS